MRAAAKRFRTGTGDYRGTRFKPFRWTLHPTDMLNATMPASRAPTEADPADDHALVRAAVAGNMAAYEQIYRRHSPRIYAVLWRLCGGHAARAEDALQDTFLQAWKALPGFRFDSSLATWLHRLGVNAALMELRASAHWQLTDAGEEGQDSLATLVAVDRCAGTTLDLERALETLPPRARAVLVLHDIEGWKHHEIAEQLQMAVGSSKAQLHRARGLLRARLGETA
jgi:RNA polymerase sigma-70 factor (ECF subfamily)